VKVFVIISVVILTFTVILYLFNPLSFTRFFGNINPLIITPIFIVLGFLILRFFVLKGGFKIYSRENLRRMLIFLPIAILLASIAILVDIGFKYSADINVLFPESLLFYPIMALIAETLFHLIPLSLLLLLFNKGFKNFNLDKNKWISIAIISLIEPIFQTFSIPGHFPLWTSAYMTFHLYLFNLTQLYFFKRFDFFSMYSFRIVYYLLWHIIWGYVRLGVLF